MKITASRMERLSLCPGSGALEEGQPEERTDIGLAGEKIHAALASVFGAVPVEIDLDDNETRIVESFTAEAQLLIEECKANGKIIAWNVEKQIESIDGYSGRPDLVIVWENDAGKSALILDWKTGWIEQEPSTSNLQLRAYAVLVALAHACSNVNVALLQRNVPTEVTRYEIQDLMKARAHLLEIVAKARLPWADRRPGEKQCRYCRGIAICPEARALVPEVLALVTPAANGIVGKDQVQTIVPRLSAEELAFIRNRKQIVDWVLDAVDSEIKERLKADPNAIPGFKLKPGDVRREITDSNRAKDLLRNVITEESFGACCTVRLKELESQYRNATGVTWAEADRMLSVLLAPVMVSKQNQPSIVRAKE